jgi:lipid II isoglutaminyl synthase (glutamine-hydrolysing)
VSTVTITVGYLYPDLMSTFGDRGNVETVRRRCAWRGIDVTVQDLLLGDRVPDDLDLIMIGGGGESQQRLVAADLYKVKSRSIRDAVAAGAAALAVGGGFELFGRFCQPEYGSEYPGVDLFDSWTVRQAAAVAGDDCDIAEARAERHLGELVVRWGTSLLIGFENHSGGTYLGATAQPLGRVLTGHGNNGDGSEGVILGSAVGTNLRGPCLPKNPVLADYLISAAVARRHAGAELANLPDELERAARDVAVQQARQAARASRRQVTRLLPRPRAQQRPAQFPAGQFPPGQFPAGQFPAGQFPPAQFRPAQFRPGQLRPGQLRPAQLRPAQQRPVSPRPAPTGRR